uniref:Uncharacterized protein n=1 Tax=Arundo donax TaxID=35708 RepID=A0A0A9SLM1_ARUDO
MSSDMSYRGVCTSQLMGCQLMEDNEFLVAKPKQKGTICWWTLFNAEIGHMTLLNVVFAKGYYSIVVISCSTPSPLK